MMFFNKNLRFTYVNFVFAGVKLKFSLKLCGELFKRNTLLFRIWRCEKVLMGYLFNTMYHKYPIDVNIN